MAEELIKVPDIGGAEGAEIVEVLVAPGDAIDIEQSLVVVESDKASMEIPAPMAGTVTELRVAVGDAVSEGDVILVLKTDSAASHAEPQGAAPDAESAAGDAPNGDSVPPVATANSGEQAAPPSDAAKSVSPAADIIDVHIPDLGSDQGADLVEILVPVGSGVEEGDSLVLLESDKASMEVPAPAAGTVCSQARAWSTAPWTWRPRPSVTSVSAPGWSGCSTKPCAHPHRRCAWRTASPACCCPW